MNETFLIPQRKFRDHEPVGHPLSVPPQFEAFDHFSLSTQNLPVVIHIGAGHQIGVQIKISHPENL